MVGRPAGPGDEGVYTRGEVLWLRQLDREGAIDFDAYPPTMRYGSTDEDGNAAPASGSSVSGAGTSAEDAQLFVIARWHDVHLARRRIIEEKLLGAGLDEAQARKVIAFQDLIGWMRGAGYTEDEVAEKLQLSRSAIRRHFKASLDALMEAVGEYVEPDRVSIVSACLECGRGSRVRLQAVRYRVKGGWRTSKPERVSALCEPCLVEHNTPADRFERIQLLRRAGVKVDVLGGLGEAA